MRQGRQHYASRRESCVEAMVSSAKLFNQKQKTLKPPVEKSHKYSNQFSFASEDDRPKKVFKKSPILVRIENFDSGSCYEEDGCIRISGNSHEQYGESRRGSIKLTVPNSSAFRSDANICDSTKDFVINVENTFENALKSIDNLIVNKDSDKINECVSNNEQELSNGIKKDVNSHLTKNKSTKNVTEKKEIVPLKMLEVNSDLKENENVNTDKKLETDNKSDKNSKLLNNIEKSEGTKSLIRENHNETNNVIYKNNNANEVDISVAKSDDKTFSKKPDLKSKMSLIYSGFSKSPQIDKTKTISIKDSSIQNKLNSKTETVKSNVPFEKISLIKSDSNSYPFYHIRNIQNCFHNISHEADIFKFGKTKKHVDCRCARIKKNRLLRERNAFGEVIGTIDDMKKSDAYVTEEAFSLKMSAQSLQKGLTFEEKVSPVRGKSQSREKVLYSSNWEKLKRKRRLSSKSKMKWQGVSQAQRVEIPTPTESTLL